MRTSVCVVCEQRPGDDQTTHLLISSILIHCLVQFVHLFLQTFHDLIKFILLSLLVSLNIYRTLEMQCSRAIAHAVKPVLKRLLKNRQNKDLNDKW